ACAAVMVPSSTSGCSASRRRDVASAAAAGAVEGSTGSDGAGSVDGTVSSVCCTTLGEAALDKPGTPNANPAAAPPSSPAVRPMASPFRTDLPAGAGSASVLSSFMSSLMSMCILEVLWNLHVGKLDKCPPPR